MMSTALVRRCLCGVTFFLVLLTLVPMASAQDERDIGILVVDMQRIQRDAAAAIGVREQSAVLRVQLEKAIADRARAISEEEATLAEMRERLGADEFRERVREFEQKVFANRDFAQRESGKLQASLADANKRLRREIAPILAALLREREAQVMLDTSQVLLSSEALDVTDEVIKRLNDVLPTMILGPVTPGE